MRRDVTMLELVITVTEHARTEGEAIATIVHMIDSGAVRLCGTFSGARIDLGEVDPARSQTKDNSPVRRCWGQSPFGSRTST
jgi:hypothetical protein